MKKYKEIFKLKKMLEDEHIPFNWIENWGYDGTELEVARRVAPDLTERYQICYPVFASEGRVLSAVQGFGTYGAEDDLIEIMGLLTPEEKKHDVVAGYLTAEDVFERIKNHYKKGGIRMKKTIEVVDEDTLVMKEIETEEDEADIVEEFQSALNCEPEEFYQKYREYKKAEAEFNAIYQPFKENLIKLHEKNADLPKIAIIGGAKVTYVSPSTRSTIDSKKLKEEEPELAKKYTKTTNVSATLRLEEI